MKRKKTEQPQPVQLSSVPASRWKMTTVILLQIFMEQQLRPTTAVRVHHTQQDQRHVQLNIDRSGGDDVTIVPSEAYLKAEEARRLAEQEGYFLLSGATWSYLADFFSGVVEQAVNSSLLFLQGTKTMLGTSIKTSEELQQNQKSICSSPGNKESRIGCGVAGKLQDEEHLQGDGGEIRTTSTSSSTSMFSSKSDRKTSSSSSSSTTSTAPSIISTTTAPATKESSTARGPGAATGTNKDVQADDGNQTQDTNARRRGSPTGAGAGTADDKDVALLHPALGSTAPSSRTPQDQARNTGELQLGVETTEGEKKERRAAQQVVSPVVNKGGSRDEDLTKLQSGEVDKAAATKHDSTSNTNRTDTTGDQKFPVLGMNKIETTTQRGPATAPSSPGAEESAGGGTNNYTTIVSSFLQPQQERVQQQQPGAARGALVETASATSSLVQQNEKQTAEAGSTSSSQDQQAAPPEPSQLVLGVHPQLFPLLRRSEEQSGSSRRCMTQIAPGGPESVQLPPAARRSTSASSASKEVPKSNHLSVNQYRAYRAEIEKLTGLDKVVGADAPAAPTTASGAPSATPGRGRLPDPQGEKPKLFVVFGNTGTGKSTLADRIIEMAGMDPAVEISRVTRATYAVRLYFSTTWICKTENIKSKFVSLVELQLHLQLHLLR